MQRPKPIVIAGIALAVILLVLGVLLFARGGGVNQDRLSDDEPAAASENDPESRCASQRTYDAIKREIFRQAATVRGSDRAAFDRISTYAALRVDRPVLRSNDEDLGTVGCSGLVTLDLPPGVAVVGGRRSLSAEVGYLLHPAADGSGDVVMLEGADPIIVPLATLARTVSQPELETEVLPGNMLESLNEMVPGDLGPEGAEPAPAPEPDPEPSAAGPSFDCDAAGTETEIAICNSAGLAALDRQMAAQFSRALAAADPAQRRLLQTTRNRFLRFREGCRSDECIADTYRGRMREITDIMAGRWRAPR